jgi:hypothetical protein
MQMKMADPKSSTMAEQKVQEAMQILQELRFPRQQVNERSALTLLSLLDLKPKDPWSQSKNPLMGITPMMEFFAKYYGKRYAPNTRETVRRQTIHQFVQAAFVVPNPDKPSRPTNSPKAVYQIEPRSLMLLRQYGKKTWKKCVKEYIQSAGSLKEQYARERVMKRIPVILPDKGTIRLSPGGQNVLVKKILDEFCPFYTPAGTIVYVGDTQKKWAYFAEEVLRGLGVEIEEHGKMPDVLVYYAEKNWLVLIEAVTSHGPVNPKRRQELKELFACSSAGLVYVTAFLNRATMIKYLHEISWETEVWVADSPTHLIHFNGERFLGPYE